MKRDRHTGRTTRTYSENSFFKRFSARCASAAIIPALLQVPAFFSCTPLLPAAAPQPGDIRIAWTRASAPPEAVDLFFFDTLGVQPLDSYQQLTGLSGSDYALSGVGAKRLVALSARPGTGREWLDIATYGNLCKHRFSLDREDPERPLLVGETLLEDGASRETTLPLRTMLSSVRIRTVSCDFSGKAYEGEAFVNSRLFLTYAATETLPLEAPEGRAVSWMNLGDADSTAVLQLPFPEMLLQEGCGSIGRERKTVDRSFYCYPPAGKAEDMPGTRLVLEGSVGGKPCYYPLELPSLAAGQCLLLDITLKRMGTPSPDIPARTTEAMLESRTLPWEERADYTVVF